MKRWVVVLSGTALIVGISTPAIVYSTVPTNPLAIDPIVAWPLAHAATVLSTLMVLAAALLLDVSKRGRPRRAVVVMLSAVAASIVVAALCVSAVWLLHGGQVPPALQPFWMLVQAINNVVLIGVATVVGAFITLFVALDSPWVAREGSGVVTAEPPAPERSDSG